MIVKYLVQENCKEDSFIILVYNGEEIYEGKAKDIPEEYWYKEGRIIVKEGFEYIEIEKGEVNKQKRLL